MKDIYTTLKDWTAKDTPYAIARVTETWRSSPRPVGSALLVGSNGEMAGSVSGGCVEKSVVQKAMKVLETGQPQLATFGVKNEEAWEVGLSCGGKIEVIIEKAPAFMAGHEDFWKRFSQAIETDQAMVWISRLAEEINTPVLFTGEDNDLPEAVNEAANRALKSGRSEVQEIGGERYFFHSFPCKPTLLIVGSAHITAELLSIARQFDFKTIIVDPRDAFARNTTYSIRPDQVLVNWPQEVMGEMKLDHFTYAVALSHDPKIDDEALSILLRSEVPYIGALGSKRTHQKRLERLKERGFSDDELSRIHAPIGLSIGAQTPAEIALSIMGEIVMVKNRL